VTPQRLLRLPQVVDLCGLRSTSIYGQAKAGLFPPPVRLSKRSSAWPEHEVAALNAARISGKTDAEIRQLVARLVAQRERPTA